MYQLKSQGKTGRKKTSTLPVLHIFDSKNVVAYQRFVCLFGWVCAFYTHIQHILEFGDTPEELFGRSIFCCCWSNCVRIKKLYKAQSDVVQYNQIYLNFPNHFVRALSCPLIKYHVHQCSHILCICTIESIRTMLLKMGHPNCANAYFVLHSCLSILYSS